MQLDILTSARKGETFFLTPDNLEAGEESDSRYFALGKANIERLANSMLKVGQTDPVIVRPAVDSEGDPTGQLRIVDGRQRWKAAQLINKEMGPDDEKYELECQFSDDVDDQTAFLISIATNNDRDNLNYVDRASAMARLKDDFGMQLADIVRQFGVSKPVVSRSIKLIHKASARLIKAVNEFSISDGSKGVSSGVALEMLDLDHDEQDALLSKLQGKGTPQSSADAGTTPAAAAAEESAGTEGEETATPTPVSSGTAAKKTTSRDAARTASGKNLTTKQVLAQIYAYVGEQDPEDPEADDTPPVFHEDWAETDLKVRVKFFRTLAGFMENKKRVKWSTVTKALDNMVT